MAALRLRLLAGAALLGAGLSGCALLAPLPEPSSLDQRLAAFPTRGLPLTAPVTIHWNEHQVPFIEAASDEDLAVALGLVHAHLRLGQMAMLRLVSQGRIAEAVGPIAVDIDRGLRILDFGRAVPQIVAALPPETRRWLEAFLRGVNHYQAMVRPLPHEYAVLGLDPEPWTLADLLTIGRLSSSDVNWLVWFGLLPQRDRPDWPQLWARLAAAGSASITSYGEGGPPGRQAFADILAGLGRSGSNAVAVAARRSAGGGALMASDPHLGIFLPNLWIAAGYKSPSYHAVGLMIPGLPFVAVGRNPWIAWSGTNMRAASSDLFDVSGLPTDAIVERRERIAVRWWFDREVTVRDTAFGPIVSDAPILDAGAGPPLALRWIGHAPSDEVTAMLRLNRARDWDEFRAALAGFAVPGENMLYADAAGHIGQAMAVHLPRRPAEAQAQLVHSPAAGAAWNDIVTGAALPVAFDPPAGVLASANNRPTPTEVPIGTFFSADDRIGRLAALLGQRARLAVDDLMRLQRDTYMASATALRDALIGRLRTLPLAERLTAAQRRVAARVEAWDGDYGEDSAGALAFELLLHHFAAAFLGERQLAAYAAAGRLPTLLREDIAGAEAEALEPALDRALAAAAGPLDRFGRWGEMHRLGLTHPLSRAPLIGGRYRFGDYPVAGSSATLMKTAHGLTDQRHATRYGSNARFIADLADLDRTYLVLLGGQDGWFGSSTFVDQVALWRRGAYMELPLRPESVRARFSHRTDLTP